MKKDQMILAGGDIFETDKGAAEILSDYGMIEPTDHPSHWVPSDRAIEMLRKANVENNPMLAFLLGVNFSFDH
jgi:hypothetical protein